jgi:hypothetical protein
MAPWTVGWGVEPEGDLIAEILLAAGKVLYIANRFEGKCRGTLRTAHLWDMIDTDPVATVADIAARMPADRLLGPTLTGLFAHSVCAVVSGGRIGARSA